MAVKIFAVQYTEVRFVSFLSGGFTTISVINPLERKLSKHTSVHYLVKAEIGLMGDNKTTTSQLMSLPAAAPA